MKTPTIIKTAIKKISSSTWGAKFLGRFLPAIDRWWFRSFGGEKTLTETLLDLPTVMVTTIGAKSGLPRTTPLIYFQDPQNPVGFALVATNFGNEKYPAWVYNLKANPRAICRLNGTTKHYLAHEIQGDEYQRYWELAINAYFGYQLYRQRIHNRPIPIFLFEPIPQDSSCFEHEGSVSPL